jgi:quercetin dioxygenase-like cupin family protein
MNLSKIIFTAIALLTSTVAFSQTQNTNKMNLTELHNDSTGVQTKMMFPATDGKVISLQILKDNQLKEHVSKIPALLVCVSGNAIYEDENGLKVTLLSGDFVKIEPNVKHWVNGIENTNLLLIK